MKISFSKNAYSLIFCSLSLFASLSPAHGEITCKFNPLAMHWGYKAEVVIFENGEKIKSFYCEYTGDLKRGNGQPNLWQYHCADEGTFTWAHNGMISAGRPTSSVYGECE